MDVWQVWEMREVAEGAVAAGMVPVRVYEFHDRATALEAAGAEDPARRET
jgi:hypothetical protein